MNGHAAKSAGQFKDPLERNFGLEASYCSETRHKNTFISLYNRFIYIFV